MLIKNQKIMQTQTYYHTLRETLKGRYYMSRALGNFERISKEDAKQVLCEAQERHHIVEESKSVKGKQWVICEEI